MKLVDCFIFYNELDMLDYRLKVLNDVVDYFVLVESTLTFAGNSKPLFFEENKQRYAKYLNKIIHIVVDDTPQTSDPWAREKYQRNSIRKGLDKLSLDDDDRVIIVDVDEIPDPRMIRQIATQADFPCLILAMDFYYYDIRHRFQYKWFHAKIAKFSHVKTSNPEDIRMEHNKPGMPVVMCGWHLSYFMSNSMISNKIRNFSHQELNTPQLTSSEHIDNCVKNRVSWHNGQRVDYIEPQANTYLPPYHEMLPLYKTSE